jgi:hypothetical protein
LVDHRPAPVRPEEDIALLPVFADPNIRERLVTHTPKFSRGLYPRGGGLRAIDWKKTRKDLSFYRLQPDPSEPDDARAVHGALKPLQPLIDQLRLSRRVAANWGDEMWTARERYDPPESGPVLCCLRLLECSALLDLEFGRPEDAREAILAQLRLGEVMRKAPTFLLSLVAASAVSIPSEIVWRGILSGKWDNESLRVFAKEFASLNSIRAQLWVLDTERAYTRDLVETMVARRVDLLANAKLAPPATFDWKERWIRFQAGRLSWWRENQLWLEAAADELAGTLDADAQLWRRSQRAYDSTKLNPRERSVKLAVAAEFMATFESFCQSGVCLHAQNKMIAIACALELARRETGKYPETLELITPAYLPNLPLDPVTGLPFRYQRRNDGTYLLYSLGLDGQDQGGAVLGEADRDKKDPDWAWWPSPPEGTSRGSAPDLR